MVTQENCDIFSRKMFDEQFYDDLRDYKKIRLIKIERSRPVNNEKYQSEIDKFTEVFLKNIDSKYHERFINNIQTVKIIKRRLFKKRFRNTASYNSHSNTIDFYDIESILHELFHLASALLTSEPGDEDDELSYVGLKDHKHGNGVNEGYTQLLTERYFDDGRTYNNLVDQMKILEYMIGEEKMHSFFFETGLKGLIDELTKYVEEEKLIKIKTLIINSDTLYGIDYLTPKRDLLNVKIFDTLFQLYSCILIYKVNNNIIDYNTAINEFDSLRLRAFSKYSNDEYFKVDSYQFVNYDKFLKEMFKRTDDTRKELKCALSMHIIKKTRVS